jgi:hypothetical protein
MTVQPSVRKPPSWPRSWANFSLLWLYSHRSAWANLHILGEPNNSLTLVARHSCMPLTERFWFPLVAHLQPAFWCACRSLAASGTFVARKVLGWPERCKLAHALLWEYSYKRLKLAQLLCQLRVFLTSVGTVGRRGVVKSVSFRPHFDSGLSIYSTA